MGKVYVPHSDMCGCERCAIQADKEYPSQVYDVVEDPDVLDCGCDTWRGCNCAQWDDYPEDEE